MNSLLTEDQYVRPFDGEKSPSTRTKWKPVSLGTVQPLVLDNTTMELVDRNMNSEKRFLEKLSQGKGASLFEVKQGQLGLENGVLNMTDIEGCSILHHAARCNKVDAVTILLDNGADIDVLNSFGYTALHIAVRYFCTETVKLLLQRGANPSFPNEEKNTPLHFAARQGCIYISSVLLEDPRADINCPNAANITPFHLACKNGDRSLCEMFLNRGADIMAKSSSSMTSLHFAASYGNVEVCELLLSKVSKRRSSLKSYIDATDIDDATALHTSCLKGYKAVVELLLSHGADYEAITTINGHSPLQLAVTYGHSEVAELLILKGAAINGRNDNLQTPLHKAALFNQTGTAEVLVKYGAELEARDMMDLTPFLIAVVKGSKETAELLLDLGSNLTAVDAVSNSCLHLAVQSGQVEIVQMLLNRGKEKLMTLRNNDLRSVIHLSAARNDAKILEILLKERFGYEQRDVNEKLPLHIAAESGSLQCVNSLMQCKMLAVHANDKDDHGMTPLHLAALNKHAETCSLLIFNGGDVAAHDENVRTALHLAVKAGSLETVKILLNPMLPSTLEEKDADQNTALHIACMHNRLDVLKFLVDKGADVTTRNKVNMTCLDVAIEWGASEVAETLVRHKRWKEVVCANSGDRSPPMEKLIQVLPDVAEIVLDNCLIQSVLPTSHPDYTITIDVFPLDPYLNNDKRKFFAPACMATYRREKLLNHCVTQALLRWKWAVLGKFLNYFNFVVFLLFVALFTVVIVKHREVTRFSFDNPDDTSTETPTEVKGIAIAIFIFLICETANEIFQICWLQTSYFKDASNLVDFSLYISVTIYILPFVTKEDLYGDSKVQWTAGSVGLLLCYLSITLSFRRLSGVALYVTMYIEVLQTFAKVISIFTIVIIGYALVFYVLLSEQDNFSSFWMSVVKVFVMMVGEMDYSDMLSEHVVNNNKVPGTVFPYVPLPVLTYLIFTLFVLTVSIILMNLLVGLAVGDIDSIQKTANLRTLVDQAFLVEKIQDKYPRWLLRRAYRSSLEIKPNKNTFANSVLLAGTSLVDQDFVDKLHAKVSNQVTSDADDLDNYDQQLRENQNEMIRSLKATVEEQSKLLRSIAERLEITQP